MSKVDTRTKIRGTLAVAVLFTGLAAAKGAAVAAPATLQPVSTTGSSSGSGTASADVMPALGAGSSTLWKSPVTEPIMNSLFGCNGVLIHPVCGIGSGVG